MSRGLWTRCHRIPEPLPLTQPRDLALYTWAPVPAVCPAPPSAPPGLRCWSRPVQFCDPAPWPQGLSGLCSLVPPSSSRPRPRLAGRIFGSGSRLWSHFRLSSSALFSSVLARPVLLSLCPPLLKPVPLPCLKPSYHPLIPERLTHFSGPFQIMLSPSCKIIL